MAPGRTTDGKSYDYVICGGGTSGCVLAGRLAEDSNVSILIIEAGAHNADLESTHMAGGWQGLFGTDGDWNIKSEPQKHANDRRIQLWRGRFLGGCSGVNGCLCIRGTKQDYDDWQIPGWAETFHDKDWFAASKTSHGYTGPLHTEPHDLAPISERVRDAMLEDGFPMIEDMFTTGESPHAIGHAPRTHHNGIRSTAADFVTNTYRRENITILTEHVVDKIVFERSAETLTAVGAEIVAKDGSRSVVHANREVVVSGGAYCSPTILMRSGLGPREELAKIGIECLVDLPGVGQNLQDHALSFVFYEVSDPQLTNDRLIYEPGSMATTYQLWKDEKKGVLSTFPFGIFAWARLDERLEDSELWQEAQKKAPDGRDPMLLTPKQPHVEYWNTELYGGGPNFTDYPVGNKGAFAMCVILMNPHSRGTVTLSDANPLSVPVVDHNYLAHELDTLVLAEGCRHVNDILRNGAATKEVVKGSWPEKATHHKFVSRDEWSEYARETVGTCYHPAGTCKMGKAGQKDKMSVVDERLRLKGVEGLRVVDVSIMPIINNGHTQMPAYAIGEKAADMLKEDAKKAK